MASNGLYSREDEEFVKRLLKSGIAYDELVRRFGLNQEQITAMFQSFRKNFYRVFPIVKCGEICLVLKDEYMKLMGYNDKIMSKKNSFKLCVITDTHAGSVNDIPGIMDKVENFCVAENIEHIIHVGDLIEGAEYYVKKYTKGKCRCETSEIEYLNKFMPYNKLTKKHILLSNHDIFSDDGIARDIIKQLHDAYGREDVVVSGFDYAELPVNGDTLYLNHGYLKNFSNSDYDEGKRLYLCGHSHRSYERNNMDQGYHVEYLPPLSNIEHRQKNRSPEENNFFVGFITLEVELNDNGTFNTIILTRYETTNSVYTKPKPLPHQSIVEYSRVRK